MGSFDSSRGFAGLREGKGGGATEAKGEEEAVRVNRAADDGGEEDRRIAAKTLKATADKTR